jgi:hypothetical protein
LHGIEVEAAPDRALVRIKGGIIGEGRVAEPAVGFMSVGVIAM